jgi:hypothetical protein
MELEKVLGLAVILGWDDLEKAGDMAAARVEYHCAVGAELEYLSVWSVDGEGHQSMLCDYWTWTAPAHTRGISFKKDIHSPGLGSALDFILMNQNQFTRPAGAFPEGLALIDPPSADERAEAAAWLAGAHGTATNVSPPDARKAAAF